MEASGDSLGFFRYPKRVRTEEELAQEAQLVPASFTERLRSREVKEGDSIRFTVRVSGKPAPNVTWYREGTQIVSSPDFEILQEGDVHTLYIPECFYEDSGKFSVQAVNAAGATDCTCELIVEAPITIEESASPTPPTSRSPSVGHLPRPAPFASGSSREATPPKAQRPAPPPQFQRPLADIVVREGERIVLECTIAPLPEPERVQWFRNEAEIRSSPDYQISYSHGSCTLTISEVFPEDAGTFTCTITVQGTSNSTYMVLKVEAPLPPPAPPLPPQVVSPRPTEVVPNFRVQLGNLPLRYGQNAYFECTVQGYPPPEILWTRRGHPLVDKTRYKSTYDQYSGTTTLTILNLRDEDEGEYTCTAINTQGEVSTSALLLGPERYAAWLQEQQPQAQATGPAPPRDARRAVVSELEAKLERTQMPRRGRESPSGFYRPMAERMLDVTAGRRLSSDAGDVSSDEGFRVSMFEKRLMKEIQYREGRVQAPPAADRAAFDESIPLSEAHAPSVEQALKNFQLMEGSDATFVCKVAGNPYPNITWYQNGRQLKPSTRYEMKLTRDGYASLRIRVAFPEDAGHYTCCATNVVGRTITSGELYVEELSKIDDTSYVAPDTLRRMMKSPERSQMQLEFGPGERPSKGEGGVAEKFYRPVFRKIPMDQESVEGQMVRFDSIVSGRPMPELFWYRDGVRVNDDYLHKIVVNEDGIHSLIFDHVAALDAGQYTCIAKNRGGEDRFVVNLNVKPREAAQAPRFADRLANSTVKEGESVVLHCEASGHPPPMMSWQKDGKIIPHDHAHYRIESAPGRTTLTIASVAMSDNAWFQCSAISVSGTAANRARLIVQELPKAKEPERKLIIPRRMTPTPTREIKMPVVETVEPSPEPVYMIVPVVTPPPQDEPPVEVQVAPPVQAPPPPPRTITPKQEPVKAFAPSDSEVLNLIKEIQHAPPPPLPLQVEIKPQSHTSARQPGTDEVDVFDRDAPRPPSFKIQLTSLPNLVEGQAAHFESRLVPIGDPDMQVEWYKDGRKLGASHRFKALYDFGFIALDIAYTYPEDDGTYMCMASNRYGSDQVSADLRCKGKSSVITDTQLPPGHESVQAIAAMEASIRREQQRSMMKELVNEEEKDDLPPVFDLKPEPVQVEEGETAKFMAKVGGHPRPRLTWWVNGSMIIAGQRFKLRYDGMIHILEVPKAREYDSGVIRVVAKNPFGEAECSSSLSVVPREDWRSRLKQAPKSIVEVEFNRLKPADLRSMELQSAFLKPKTTVVELRQFERLTQEKTRDYRDEEVQKAFASINLQHAQMVKDKPNPVMSALEPMSYIDRQVHIERAQHMLDMLEAQKSDEAPPTIPRAKIERKDPPTFTKPLAPVKVKEGSEAKYVWCPWWP